MSQRPVIITPGFIRRHNWRCLGRMVLSLCGATAVFFMVFVFAWLLASFVTGKRELDGPTLVFAGLFGTLVFALGHRYRQKHGPQDWERVARKPDRKPGMRLSRMSNQEYGQIGEGLLGLVLAGPGWLAGIVEEGKAMMSTSPQFAERLETLRTHLAAREGWVPMKDFRKYEGDLYRLARMNIVAVRELLGEWHFHVTLEGTVNRRAGAEGTRN